MLRTIYHPDTWPLRITCLNADGTPKTDPEEEWVVQDVAGPCCIQVSRRGVCVCVCVCVCAVSLGLTLSTPTGRHSGAPEEAAAA